MHGTDRREFLNALGAWGLLAAAPRAIAQTVRSFPAYPFTLGVASGYPRPTGITWWTRLPPRPDEPAAGMPPQPVPVRWEVASDESMRTLVAAGMEMAGPDGAHSGGIDVEGLQPGREYWYRFISADATSPVGRTKTAPAENERVS